MSASLVGSEMCIRDSLRQVRVRGREPRRGARGDGRCVRLQHGQGGEREAVSYTHLTLPTICSV
eukprot:2573919-Alexandrium_andersonii.AAC.1